MVIRAISAEPVERCNPLGQPENSNGSPPLEGVVQHSRPRYHQVRRGLVGAVFVSIVHMTSQETTTFQKCLQPTLSRLYTISLPTRISRILLWCYALDNTSYLFSPTCSCLFHNSNSITCLKFSTVTYVAAGWSTNFHRKPEHVSKLAHIFQNLTFNWLPYLPVITLSDMYIVIHSGFSCYVRSILFYKEFTYDLLEMQLHQYSSIIEKNKDAGYQHWRLVYNNK